MLNTFLKKSLICTLTGLSTITCYAYSCNPSPTAVRSAPDSRYTIINDGTEVKDKRTGLIWQRCAIGKTFDGKKCAGVSDVYDWKKMLVLDESLKKGVRIDEYSSKSYRVGETINYDGTRIDESLNNGHRIPTIKELESLVEIACSEKVAGAIAINTNVFPNTQTWFKSFTPDLDNKDKSIDILFSNGNGKGSRRYSYPKEGAGGHIRLVRDK